MPYLAYPGQVDLFSYLNIGFFTIICKVIAFFAPKMYYLNHFETYEELVDAVGQFIHYYNYQRRQHRLNCLAPMNYRSLLDAA